MDHACTAFLDKCVVCDQRAKEQELFNENGQLKATNALLAEQNDKLICNLVEIAANLGVPPNQVGYDNTMLRVHAYKKLLEACRIYVSTGDHDLILRALIPFASDPT